MLPRALAWQPQQSLLSIATAGDNTLALWAHSPQRVVAVDLSAPQIAALNLRVRSPNRWFADALRAGERIPRAQQFMAPL